MATCPVNRLMTLDNFAHGAAYALLDEWQQQGPVVWEEDDVSPRGGHWNVFSREQVDAVMRAPQLFSNANGPRLETPPPGTIREGAVSPNLMDGSLHRKTRSLIDKAFKPEPISRREEYIRQIARELIDEIIDQGSCEFVQSVAQRLPLAVISWILGIPDEDKQKVCDLANTMMLADDPDFSTGQEESLAAQAGLVRYGATLAADHRNNPRDSLTMDLLLAEDDGNQLSDKEYGLLFLNLIIGGIETTRNATAYGLAELIRRPDQFQMLASDAALIPDAVEEILRYRPPIMNYRRTALQDTGLAGKQIKKGDTVIVWFAAANRDETVFEEPDHFDVTRCQRESVRRDHRTFGFGVHHCLGFHLARMQLIIIFEQITSRMKNIQLVDEPKNVRSVFMDGYKEMNIAFERK